MIRFDNDVARKYLADSIEHLTIMETDLFALERNPSASDGERIERVFRALHSIQGGAHFFDLGKAQGLAHQMEAVMALIRSHELASSAGGINILLRATGSLRAMLQDPARSNQADVAEILAALADMSADGSSTIGETHQSVGNLRTLLVEDDFSSRRLLQTFLSRYGQCHVAVNGREAVDAVGSALALGEPYDLICMDVMMPEMDGREAVRQIRALEEAHGILSTVGAKIIMTTAVDDIKEVSRCFQELCDDYLLKPIDLRRLLSHMRSYQLVP